MTWLTCQRNIFVVTDASSTVANTDTFTLPSCLRCDIGFTFVYPRLLIFLYPYLCIVIADYLYLYSDIMFTYVSGL